MADEVVFDVKKLLNQIKSVEPKLKKELIKSAKVAAEPALSAVKSGIPTVNPYISSKRTPNVNGRLAWGAIKPANAVKFSYKTSGSKFSAVTSLFKLWVQSPATVIADTAGKGSGVPVRSTTNPYAYQGRTRTHKVTTQGRSMIRHLQAKGRRGSNFVYPSVEHSLPSVRSKLKLVVDGFAEKMTKEINNG